MKASLRAAPPLVFLLTLAACRTVPERSPDLGNELVEPRPPDAGEAAALGLPPGWPSDSILRRSPEPAETRHGWTGHPLPDTVGILLHRRLVASGGSPTVSDPVHRYLLWLPPGLERADRPWPLILYLHGRSLRGNDLDRVKRYGIPAFLDRGWALPFVIVAPQLPSGGWDRPHLLLPILEEVLDLYPIDRDRVYLTGFSMGADGTWLLALAHPEPFAAAVPISAWTPDPDRVDLSVLEGLPVRIYHGTADDITPFERAKAMARAMAREGLDVRFTPLEGGGHGIVNDVYGESVFYRWLLERRRQDISVD